MPDNMPANIPELLSPAGSPQAAEAALAGGADALYLGASAFGARAQAGFDQQALRDVIARAHLFGRRVYVTVNILVKQREWDGLRDTLRAVYEARADAVLVQDLGALALIKREFPALCVHASTQMSLHSAAGARLAQALGASRVVLARECTLEQIRAVAATGIETEVFVHGAQCVCISGQCRYSGLIGGRSGNRGKCAQPCRLPYAWDGKTAAWLSPRDLCLRDHLDELAAAGVHTLKIEGRLKRPEYVYAVTHAYRRALDALAAGRFAPADAGEKTALSQVFSRSFFPGYAFGARDAQVMNPERSGAMGVEIGRVTRVWQRGDTPFCEAALTSELNAGDGLQLRGGREQDIIYAGAPVQAGGTAVLRLHGRANAGERVIRIDDESQLSACRAACEKGLERVLPFDALLACAPGEPAALTVWDERARVTVTGEPAQTAQSAALDAPRARRALEKTGGTPFSLRELTVTGANAYLNSAALNDLRRRALDALAQARIAAHILPAAAPLAAQRPVREGASESGGRGLLYAQTASASLARELLDAGADRVLYAPEDYTAPALENALDALPKGALVALAPVLADDTLNRVITLAKARGLALCAGSVGQLSALPAPCLLGEGVPVWNGEAGALLRALGGEKQVLPRELTRAELRQIPASGAEMILPVYGRARLMYLHHCPARTARGLSGERSACQLCAHGAGCRGQALSDRTGARFPLLPVRMADGCVVQLLSDRARDLGERSERAYSWLLDFTIEDDAEALAVTRAYRALLDGTQGRAPGYLERWEKGVE